MPTSHLDLALNFRSTEIDSSTINYSMIENMESERSATLLKTLYLGEVRPKAISPARARSLKEIEVNHFFNTLTNSDCGFFGD